MSSQVAAAIYVGVLIVIPAIILIIWGIVKTTREFDEKLTHMVKAQLLDKHGGSSTVTTSTGSAVGRGLVGAAIAGPVGAVVGAGTAKQKVTQSADEYVFRVFWDNDTVTIEKCTYNSDMYNKCIEKLEV